MIFLRVLPGWPEPQPVSDLHLLLITVLGPLTFGLVIAAIAWAPRMMKRNRAEAEAVGLGDPAHEAIEAPVGARHAEITS
ncbi:MULTISPECIES: hypothetical protein [Aestuariimicrobium]|uniref:hypothetical protein n=1 Tax=Aestuariimicrobium TaxID=396388 RepID=UPI0003B7696B|nr:MULTISPECIES: hypothetical protein [Aestuariimicrobium]CAI9407780.1 hypothetical protein AESSP_01893 [Aestuariimicrobium sp. T2.26MG-19.2B]